MNELSTIILPIKPEYAYKILSGKKKYEYRKKLAVHNITRIVIYASSPVSKVVGEVSVSGYLKAHPDDLWNKTQEHSGITFEKYSNYFADKKIAYAYCLKKAITYAKPKTLDEYGLHSAPQSFAYLKECPYCGELIQYKKGICSNATSVEHIIPESLGNDQLVINSGHICDKCNNYFATHIENQFLNFETVKILRSIHNIISKKGKIPDLEILFANENTRIEWDPKSGNAFIGLSPETIDNLMSGETVDFFISKGINIDELTNNYIVSRFLIKVFSELNLYYALKHYSDIKLLFIEEGKMRELFDYARKGSKCKKVYSYTVKQIKEVSPFANDDFICSIEITHDNSSKLTGMILRLYELEFILNI